MSRALCPKCGKLPTRHKSKDELIEHLVECNMFLNYTKHLLDKKRKGSKKIDL